MDNLQTHSSRTDIKIGNDPFKKRVYNTESSIAGPSGEGVGQNDDVVSSST